MIPRSSLGPWPLYYAAIDVHVEPIWPAPRMALVADEFRTSEPIGLFMIIGRMSSVRAHSITYLFSGGEPTVQSVETFIRAQEPNYLFGDDVVVIELEKFASVEQAQEYLPITRDPLTNVYFLADARLESAPPALPQSPKQETIAERSARHAAAWRARPVRR